LVALMVSILGGVTATRPAVRVSLPPPSPAASVPAGLRCPEWYQPAQAAGWSDAELGEVDRIMWRESKCEPGTTRRNANGTIDRGLMQINDINLGWLGQVGVTADDLLDGNENLKAARMLYEQLGWSPWRPLP
jgi:Lysozyme like domain